MTHYPTSFFIYTSRTNKDRIRESGSAVSDLLWRNYSGTIYAFSFCLVIYLYVMMFRASVLIAGIIMTPTHMFWQTVKTHNTRYPMNEWMNEKLQTKQNKTKRNDICVRNYMCSILTDCVLTQLTISGFKKNKIKGAENKYYPSLVIITFPQQLCDCVSEAHLLQNG